jgi:SecD/SecF fusion protein
VKDILKGLANNSQDPVFNKALADATTNLKGNQTYLMHSLKLLMQNPMVK